jgi:hypothetical protein
MLTLDKTYSTCTRSHHKPNTRMCMSCGVQRCVNHNHLSNMCIFCVFSKKKMNNCTNMHKRHQRNRSTVFSATAIKKGIVFELEGCSLASTCGTFSICMLRYCIAWKTCKHNLHILHVSPTVGRCWHIMAYVGWKTIGYCYVWHHCCVATGGNDCFPLSGKAPG